MIKIIRAALKTLTGTVYRTFSASGRSDEEIGGKLVQHYGFSSNPPEGVELITLQMGNNNFSIAENDGSGRSVNLPAGGVSLYLPNKDGGEPKSSVYMYTDDQGDPALFIASEGVVSITCGDSSVVMSPSNNNISVSCSGTVNLQNGALTVDA